MVQSHGRSRRTKTGAKLKKFRKKRKYELGRPPIETKLGIERKKIIRTRGGNFKIKLYSGNTVNVADPKTKEIKNVRIKNVEHNDCSIDYSRRSIITKGAIVETELGFVKITSRPGQHGILNGVLIDYKKAK
ncbi:MAG: 30S ribosomal protein S8e [Promethearchaeota archaeon]